MSTKDYNYGICGVYCGQCPSGNGRVRFMAGELKRLVDTTRYEWSENEVNLFQFKEFRKGLEWFSSSQCPMCLNIENPWCKNRECASEKGIKSCLLCSDFLSCQDTDYQREWYPFVVDNYNRVREIGFEEYLKEEEEKARAGVDLMSHLERRCCKVVKLEDEKDKHEVE